VADSLPAQCRLRWFPAEFTDWRGGEGDALEHAYGVIRVENPFNNPSFDFYQVLWHSCAERSCRSEAGESGDTEDFCKSGHLTSVGFEKSRDSGL
jgi:hypothetical protein